jgi:hypothetical protein
MLPRALVGLLLPLLLLLGACGPVDDPPPGKKSAGEKCFSGSECKSGTCLSVTRECL